MLVTALLTACSDPADQNPAGAAAAQGAGSRVSGARFAEKGLRQDRQPELSPHPLLEPLSGKITYNEKVTSRISSPVAGRVIATPVALGAQVQTGSTLLELDSPMSRRRSDYAKAQADLTLASHALNRQKELYAGKAVALKELEQAQDDFKRRPQRRAARSTTLENLRISAQQNDGRFALRSRCPAIVVERNVQPGIEVRARSRSAVVRRFRH